MDCLGHEDWQAGIKLLQIESLQLMYMVFGFLGVRSMQDLVAERGFYGVRTLPTHLCPHRPFLIAPLKASLSELHWDLKSWGILVSHPRQL